MKSITKLLWIIGWLLVGHLAVVDTVSAQLEREFFTFLPFIEGGGSSGVPVATLNKWQGDIQESVSQEECFWVNEGDFGAELSSGEEKPITGLSDDIIDVVDEKYPHSRISQILVCPTEINGFTQHIVSVILTMPDPVWTASYYRGKGRSNVLATSKFQRLYNQDWGVEAPIKQNGIGVDDFSIVFERTIAFTGNYYEFAAQADDCVRVSLDALNDGKDRYDLIIDGWHEHDDGQPKRCNIDEVYKYNDILDGLYKVRVEYYEAGGNAKLDFRYEEYQCCWNASYFNNKNLDGPPALTRKDPIKSHQLDFVWGEGSPGNGVNENEWSAQWKGVFAFDHAEYEFWTESDDGVRVFLDNDRIFDKWTDGGAKKFCAKRSIDAGSHRVNVDYYENRGAAKLKVWWKRHVNSATTESICAPNDGPCIEERPDRCEDHKA